MDRKNIEKIAHTSEERMLLAKLWDKMNAGMNRNIFESTGFLSPQEQEMARFLFGNAPGIQFFGGYDDAERKMLCYLPEYLDEEFLLGCDSPIACLHAVFYAGDTLTHRDFLGALMGIGIQRETLGDICVGNGMCDFFVTREIAPYILQTLTSAGRTKITLTQIDVTHARITEPEVKEIRDTLSSLRLDSVVSAGFRISRSLAAEAVSAGKVAVDGLPVEKPDKLISQGSKISLRGSGKILLYHVGDLTKKGRISVTIHRYI